MLFIHYPKCTTCKKAKKWLDEAGISYTERNIVEENPTYDELCAWKNLGDIETKKFFNTSGVLYRSMKLREKLASMTDEERLKLLASNGMLVKRPIIVTDDAVLIGFKEEKWQALINQ